jgi:hypothetical protein
MWIVSVSLRECHWLSQERKDISVKSKWLVERYLHSSQSLVLGQSLSSSLCHITCVMMLSFIDSLIREQLNALNVNQSLHPQRIQCVLFVLIPPFPFIVLFGQKCSLRIFASSQFQFHLIKWCWEFIQLRIILFVSRRLFSTSTDNDDNNNNNNVTDFDNDELGDSSLVDLHSQSHSNTETAEAPMAGESRT